MSTLLLYVDEDFIVPVACDSEGRQQSIAKDGDDRLWLYFASMPAMAPDFAYKYRNYFVAGEPGYYGDFFKAVEAGSTAQINGRDLPYFELLRQGDFLAEIRALYRGHTGATDAKIPTAYVFAESIGLAARKLFLSAMAKEGFECLSFSLLPGEILSAYVQAKRRDMEPEFGDYLLFLNSAGDSLRISHGIWDGNVWLCDGTFKTIQAVGDSPLKDALVKYVVDEVDKNRGYLSAPGAKEREYAFQKKNADRWLDLQRMAARGNVQSETVDFDIDDFTYSVDPNMRFSCHVSGNFLRAVQDQAVGSSVKAIGTYVEECAIKNRLKAVVFIGRAFDDERFATMVWNELDNPSFRVPITSIEMGRAYGSFFQGFINLQEPLGKFSEIMKRKERERKGVAEWIKAAGRINDLIAELKAFVPRFKNAVSEDASKVEEMLGLVHDRLKVSKFDEAKEKLRMHVVPSEKVREMKSRVGKLKDALVELETVFAKIQGLEGARAVSETLIQLGGNLDACIQQEKENTGKISKAGEIIEFFRNHYDEYQEKLARFRRSRSLLERKELVKGMSEITMEELPAVELPHVTAEVKYQVETRRAGLFRRKKYLIVSVTVRNGETLPCPAILNISCSPMVEACLDGPTCIGYEIAKGEREFSHEICVDEEPRLKGCSRVFIYLNPHPQELDRKAVQSEQALMSLNL